MEKYHRVAFVGCSTCFSHRPRQPSAGLPGSPRSSSGERAHPLKAPPHLCRSESSTIKSSGSCHPQLLQQNKRITNAIHLHLIDDISSEIFTLHFLFKSLLSNFRPQLHFHLVKGISNISKQMCVSFLTQGQCRGVPETLNSCH